MSGTWGGHCRGLRGGGLGVIIPLQTASAPAAATVVSVETTQYGGTYTVTGDTVLFVTALDTGPTPTLTYDEAG